MTYPRERLFVDSPFQGRLLLRLVSYWAIYHLTLWHLLFLYNLVVFAMNSDSTEPAKGIGTLYREFAINNASIVVCFLVMLPILCRDLLRFSHRFAGPLIRFRNTMERMANGEPVEPVTLRKYDLPSQFLNVFNRMVKTWNERVDGPARGAAVEQEPELLEISK